jgi:gamma-glutamylcyclotransferase
MRPYFAYGSNLWRKQMGVRCPEHRILGAGVLTGYRWIVTTRGSANVVLSAPDLVLGVVYALSQRDEDRLDCHEGVRQGGCRKASLSVQTGLGVLSCLVYLDRREQEGDPEEEFVARMRKGVLDAGLPSLYVERYLEKIMHWREAYARTG